jgi:HEAT repeat protein
MLSSSPAPPVSIAMIAFVVAGITGAAWIARATQRRARQNARRAASDLGDSLRAYLEGRLDAAALAVEAAHAEGGAFWSELEELASVPAAWRPLAKALARTPHLDAERQALGDDSPWRRELAARRLALLPTRDSRAALRRAMAAGPELVTAATALALGRHRDRAALAWLLAHPAAVAHRTPRARVALLRAFGSAGLPDLAAALERGTGESAMDRAVIEVLGLGAHEPAADAIERRLQDPEVEIRVASARALGRLAAVTATTSLMGALQDEEWPVRAQAARALGRIRAPMALLELPSRLTDPAWWVRRHAAYALLEFGEEGAAELRHIAGGSPDPYARDMAREALEAAPGR